MAVPIHQIVGFREDDFIFNFIIFFFPSVDEYGHVCLKAMLFPYSGFRKQAYKTCY